MNEEKVHPVYHCNSFFFQSRVTRINRLRWARLDDSKIIRIILTQLQIN